MATRIIWNHTSDVSVGAISSSGDDVIVLAGGGITVGGDVDAASLKLYAGATFTITGSSDNAGDSTSVSYSGPSALSGGTNQINGDLNIDNDVTVSGGFEVSGGGTVDVGGDIDCDSYISLDNSTSINVTGDVSAPANNVVLQSDGDIFVGGSIEVSDAVTPGSVHINANRGGSGTTDEFVVGGTSTNGVGSINTTTDIGGGDSDLDYGFSIYIKNGGQGGIRITDPSLLTVSASESKNGFIALESTDGTITIESGMLTADGTPGYSAGRIDLLADKVDFAADSSTGISVSDDGTAELTHFLLVAANEIDFGATSINFTSTFGGAIFAAQGAETLTSTWTPVYLHLGAAWTNTGPFDFPGQVKFDGEGDLYISADGDGAYVFVGGSDISFNGGDVYIDSNGSEENILEIAYTPADSGGLAFNGGAVHLDVSADFDDDDDDITAGLITINCANITLPNSVVWVTAYPNNNGDGGEIEIASQGADTFVVSDGTIPGFYLDTNANSGFDGDGGTVSVSVQSELNAYGFAKADGRGSGNGGAISMLCGSFTSSEFTQVSASAPDPTATGKSGILLIQSTSGSIQLDGIFSTINGATPYDATKGMTFISAAAIVMESEVELRARTYIPLSDTSGDGDGSQINITATTDLTLAGTLESYGKGAGNGGYININFSGQLLSFSAELNADGGATGNGGLINVVQASSGSGDFEIGSGSAVHSNGGATSGNGNSVTITASNRLVLDAGASIFASAQADGSGGTGGGIFLNTSNSVGAANPNVDVAGILSADGVGANGGTINITYSSDSLSVDNQGVYVWSGGEITANGTGAGQILVNSAFIVVKAQAGDPILPDGIISAFNGAIVLTSTGASTVQLEATDLTGMVSATGTAYLGYPAVLINVYNNLVIGQIMASNSGLGASGDVVINALDSSTPDHFGYSLTIYAAGLAGGAIVADGNIQLSALSYLLALGASDGYDYISAGGNLTLASAGMYDGNVYFGSKLSAGATGTVSITRGGTSDIAATGTGNLRGLYISLSVNNGNINGGSGVPMEIATKNLTVSSAGLGGENRLHNTNPDSDPITLASGTSVFGVFALSATGSMTVSDIRANVGDITLLVDTGTITVNGDLNADGTVTLLNNDPGGFIAVADSVTITSGGGTVSVSTGGSPTRTFPAHDNDPPTHQTIPDNITVSPALSSNVYFGGVVPNGITADSSGVSINAGTGGGVVALDTNGITSTQITLGGGVALTAS